MTESKFYILNRTNIKNFKKYHIINFIKAKLIEMETTEQNKVALYLFNSIKILS